ncbi:MAG TPA: 50S ribosomal protein L18e [Patescibacteria group bacterium]|nr:50S ribosomal protein L18e [Patescibacteria group bacterium]
MKSKTKISRQLERKQNPYLAETVIHAKKNDKWKRVAEILSSPRKNRLEKNLVKINEESKDGEVVVIPGKVLSVGNLDKKIRIIALNFSHGAEEKILKSGSKISTILDEIKKNPEAKGVKILE